MKVRAMAVARRNDDRRRRVLLSAGGDQPDLNLGRATSAQLRQARRPTVAFGSRVRRSLRGRWFSLVPGSTAAMLQSCGLLISIVLTVTGLHHCTMTVASIAERPEWISMLQIDLPGSLGRYLGGMLWLLLAGVATLIYQLRCYRNDDFGGQYRLWRIVIACCFIASLCTAVPLVGAAGAVVESLVGRRVALSGADWIRLLAAMGGFVLAIRVVAELWGQRAATLWNVIAWTLMTLPAAVHWNLFVIDRPWPSTLVIAAPLLATMCWLIAATLYLRVLFAQARGIQPAPSWWSRWSARWSPRSSDQTGSVDEPVTKATPKAAATVRVVATPKATPLRAAVTKPMIAPEHEEQPADVSPATSQRRRSWWPTWKRTSQPAVNAADGITADDNIPTKDVPAPKATVAATTPPSAPRDVASTDASAKPKRSWFPALRRKGAASSDETPTDAPLAPSPTRTAAPVPASSAHVGSHDDPDGDDDADEEGDSSGLSKAERRRLRKLSRRGGRAA